MERKGERRRALNVCEAPLCVRTPSPHNLTGHLGSGAGQLRHTVKECSTNRRKWSHNFFCSSGLGNCPECFPVEGQGSLPATLVSTELASLSSELGMWAGLLFKTIPAARQVSARALPGKHAFSQQPVGDSHTLPRGPPRPAGGTAGGQRCLLHPSDAPFGRPPGSPLEPRPADNPPSHDPQH